MINTVLSDRLKDIKSQAINPFNHSFSNIPVQYGAVIRISGTSWGDIISGGDTYYILVGADSSLYIGIQINQASKVTWKLIS